MSFATIHKWVVYAISGLGLASLSLGGEFPPIALAFLGIGFVASWFVEPPLVPRTLFFSERWAWGWTALLGLFLGAQLLRWLLLGDSPLVLGLEMAGALTVSRLMSRRRAAEHQQIVLLSFLHLGASTALTDDLIWAVPFFGFVTVMPWALALSYLRAEIEAHFVEPAGGGDQDAALFRILSSKRLISGRFLLGTASISIPLFLVTAVLFVLFPRVGLNFLAGQRASATQVTGFGDEVRLGDVGSIRTDGTVVMRVVPPDLPDEPPERASLRLRGTSFDRYDGAVWSHTLGGYNAALNETGRFYRVTRMPDEANDRPTRISLTHVDPPMLFLPVRTVAIEVGAEARRGGFFDLSYSDADDVRYDDTEGLGLRYVAWTPPRGAVEPQAGLTMERMERYLAVPEGHEDVVALARRWTEGASSDRERAERIWLALAEGDLEYSLDMRDPGGRTPLSAFLFVHRAGHCEYFASAMAIMLRGVGVPSRSVTGFLGGEWNPFGRHYAIRSSDAHAWVEAYLPGEGWVTFDPTPASRSEMLGGGWLSSLSHAYEAIAAQWDELVVFWDAGSQASLVRSLFRWLPRRSRRGPTPAEVPDASTESTAPRASASWVVLALALLGAVAALVAWARVRRRPTLSSAQRLLFELDRALKKRAAPRPPHRTPSEHARALSERGFAGHEDVTAVVERYNQARFGGAALDEAELAALRARARRVAEPRATP